MNVEIYTYPLHTFGHTTASMGPRSNERGNEFVKKDDGPRILLQWGHVQMNVEMSALRRWLRTWVISFNGATFK